MQARLHTSLNNVAASIALRGAYDLCSPVTALNRNSLSEAGSNSINEFVCALLLIELLLFFWSECGLSEPDHHLIQLARKLEWHMVVFAYGCTGIFTNVEGLVRRDAERNSSRQLLFGNFLSVYGQRSESTLANPTTVVLEIKVDGVFPGSQSFLALNRGPFNTHQVVVEDGLAFEQVKPKAAEPATLRQQHAFCAACWDLHIGRNAVGLVLEIRCTSLRNTDHAGKVGEFGAASSQAGAKADVESFDLAVVDRQHVIFASFGEEEVLKLAKLLGLLRGEVIGFAEVFFDVVEFPLVIFHRHAGAHDPGKDGGRGGGDPAIVVDGAVAEHFKILCAMD